MPSPIDAASSRTSSLPSPEVSVASASETCGPKPVEGPRSSANAVCQYPATAPQSVAAPAHASEQGLTSAGVFAVCLGVCRPGSAPADLSTAVGSLDYYAKRNADFLERHPGEQPPPYYLEYGDKYAHAFQTGTKAKLSPLGQEWLEGTFRRLQDAIEDKRREDPAAFERLESDPEAFRKFAYQTHSKAYVESGLAQLSPADLVQIGCTPGLKDLLTRDGLDQVIETVQRGAAEFVAAHDDPKTLAIDVAVAAVIAAVEVPKKLKKELKALVSP